MSLKVRSFVAEHSKLKGSARSVLLEIAHFADDSGGGIYASVPTLARRIGRSVRTVQRGLDTARKADELAIYYNRGPKGTNHYRIRLEKISVQNGLKKSATVTGDKLTHKGSALKREHYSSTERLGLKRGADSGGPEASILGHRESDPTLRCPDCGLFGGRCNCDDYLQATFDASIRESLGAGRRERRNS
jgi:Helix-turn-helix domain